MPTTVRIGRQRHESKPWSKENEELVETSKQLKIGLDAGKQQWIEDQDKVIGQDQLQTEAEQRYQSERDETSTQNAATVEAEGIQNNIVGLSYCEELATNAQMCMA